MSPNLNTFFRRQYALPGEHGAWVFILSPLIIGLFAGNNFTSATIFLIVAAMAAFLIRQPASMAIKSRSGRRPKRDLIPSLFWIGVYAITGILAVAGLILMGFTYLLYLAIPGIPVFIWHLWLVGRRAERRQIGVEVVGSGVLALAAPAGYWVGIGEPGTTGWLLFGLVWLQSAASIVYAYLRLQQREWADRPNLTEKLRAGNRALLYTTFNLIAVSIGSVFSLFSIWLWLPYAVQWIESVWGTLNPAVGVKPVRIGLRQLIISSIFTLLFLLIW